AVLVGRGGETDDDRRHAGDGGKGREQIGREVAIAHENVGGEERVVAESREVGGGTRMAEEELALGCDEQDREGRGGPRGPEVVADGSGETKGFGEAGAGVWCERRYWRGRRGRNPLVEYGRPHVRDSRVRCAIRE